MGEPQNSITFGIPDPDTGGIAWQLKSSFPGKTDGKRGVSKGDEAQRVLKALKKWKGSHSGKKVVSVKVDGKPVKLSKIKELANQGDGNTAEALKNNPSVKYFTAGVTVVAGGKETPIAFESKSPGKIDSDDIVEAKKKARDFVKNEKIEGPVSLEITEPDPDGDGPLTEQTREIKTTAKKLLKIKTPRRSTRKSKAKKGAEAVDPVTEPTELPAMRTATIQFAGTGKGKKAKPGKTQTISYPPSLDDAEDAANFIERYKKTYKIPGGEEKREALMNATVKADGKTQKFSEIFNQALNHKKNPVTGSEADPAAKDFDDIFMPPWEDSGYGDINELLHKSREIDRMIMILLAALKSGNIDVLSSILNLLGMQANITVSRSATMATEALAKLNQERNKVSEELASLYEDSGDEDDASDIGSRNAAIQRARNKLETQSTMRDQWMNILRENNDYRQTALNFGKSWLDSIARDAMRYIFQ